jgi:ABC-2 type transport system permease protein
MAAALAQHGARRAFVASAVREWKFLRGSPWDMALATWLPFLCLATLAWLLSSGVPRGIPIAIVDEDHSALSRGLTRALGAAPAITIVAQPPTLSRAWELARGLGIYAVVYIPPRASRDIARGGSATVFAYYNASYRTAGQAALSDIGSAVQSFAGQVAAVDLAKRRGLESIRLAPVVVQTTMLFNPARSYEYFLLALLFPAVLHLGLTLSVASALGRELRDGSAAEWLTESSDALLPAIGGKVLPYIMLFLAQGIAGIVWLASIRDDGVQGSLLLLVTAQILFYLAYAAIALLFVGATRNMATALSLVSVYAGTSIAFSGMTFPVQEASAFVRTWNLILPYTSYVKLQVQQLTMGAPMSASLAHVAALLAFIIIPGTIGGWLYGRAVRAAESSGLQ